MPRKSRGTGNRREWCSGRTEPREGDEYWKHIYLFFFLNDKNFPSFYWPKNDLIFLLKKKQPKCTPPCLGGPSSQGKTAKIHETCINNITKLTTWALCHLNISQENRSDELLGIHFTDQYHPTDSLQTAPPKRKKFPEWQFPLNLCRKNTPPVGMVCRMACDAKQHEITPQPSASGKGHGSLPRVDWLYFHFQSGACRGVQCRQTMSSSSCRIFVECLLPFDFDSSRVVYGGFY